MMQGIFLSRGVLDFGAIPLVQVFAQAVSSELK